MRAEFERATTATNERVWRCRLASCLRVCSVPVIATISLCSSVRFDVGSTDVLVSARVTTEEPLTSQITPPHRQVPVNDRLFASAIRAHASA